MDRLDAMSILIAVVETGSFSAAGRKLGAPLPTVSRKVAELEEHLKARLLVRTTRKLTLTDAGQAYLEACRRILEQVSDAERAVAGEYTTPKGELVVTTPIAFGRLQVVPVVSGFLAAFPEVSVRMALSDRNLHLVEEHIDVAVRIGALPDSSLVATRVGSVRRVVCGSPGFFAERGTPRTPDDLNGMAAVAFDGVAAGAAWMFARPGRGSGSAAAIDQRLAVNTAEAAVDAAVAGVGVVQVLSYQAAEAVAAGRLQIVLADYEAEPLPVSLIHAGQGLSPLKTRRFLEFAVPRLRSALADLPGAITRSD